MSKITGLITGIIKNGCEQLSSSVQLSAMRAPTDNEQIIKNEWYSDTASGENLEKVFTKTYECTSANNVITVKGSLAGISRMPFLRYTLTYTFFGNGEVKISLLGDIREKCVWLPRLGFEFKTPYSKDHFKYFGMGDLENYIDMNSHAKMGMYQSDADSQYVNYIMPQEHGNHTKTKLLYMENGLKFTTDTYFEFNVSHYSSFDLMKATHIDELVKSKDTIIRIDYKNSGIGSASCGTSLLDKYKLSEKHIDFSFYIA